MISLCKENEEFYSVFSKANSVSELVIELTDTIKQILELQLFKNHNLEFYLDGTNGSYFIYEVENDGERIDESITVHFCALEIWENYTDTNEFDADMLNSLKLAFESILTEKISIPFRIIVRDELDNTYVLLDN